jgi:Arc/MetJ-type ribon-helix-helix transcriptional regulator
MMDTEKVTLTLPKPLLERLEQIVPKEQRDRFVSEAILEHLILVEQSEVLDKTAGAWQDQNHPEMKSEHDIDNWLRALRQGWA